MNPIHILPALSDNYIYLLNLDGVTLAVDAGEAQPVIRLLEDERVTLDYILNTHHHYDHAAGNLELKEHTGCRIIGPEDDRISGLDQTVGDGDTLDDVGGIEVLATPGHASSDISFYLPPRDAVPTGLVCTGDTLFVGGCGRLFECGPETLWTSLNRLAALPPETQVYCGHEYTIGNYRFAIEIEPDNETVRDRLREAEEARRRGAPTVPSTIARERDTNPFLRAGTDRMKQALGMPDATSVDVFAELRRRKDRF